MFCCKAKGLLVEWCPLSLEPLSQQWLLVQQWKRSRLAPKIWNVNKEVKEKQLGAGWFFLCGGWFFNAGWLFLALAHEHFLSTLLSPGSACQGNVAIGVSNIHMHTSLFLTHQYLHGNHRLFKKLIVVVFNNCVWSTKHCLDLMCWRLRASLKNLTLQLHLNVTLLGEKMVHVLYLDHKAKGKVQWKQKERSSFSCPFHSLFWGIQYSTTYFLS